MYCIRDVGSRKIVESGFDSREQAKKQRDEFNKNSNKEVYVVSRSPDHPHGETKPSSAALTNNIIEHLRNKSEEKQ